MTDTTNLLLNNLRNELQLTILDEATKIRLERYLEEGKCAIRDRIGMELDYTLSENKAILINYCVYAYYHMLDEFFERYKNDVAAIKKREALKYYANKLYEEKNKNQII